MQGNKIKKLFNLLVSVIKRKTVSNMKRVINFVKGKRDEKKDSKVNPTISVEITNPSGQKITTDDEHIMGLQPGYGYSIDINGKDRNMLKIHKAAWFGNVEKLKLHSKKTDINTVDAMNRTCLHLAVAQGHTEVAWYLLNNNASMTIADNEGLTPFLKVYLFILFIILIIIFL